MFGGGGEIGRKGQAGSDEQGASVVAALAETVAAGSPQTGEDRVQEGKRESPVLALGGNGGQAQEGAEPSDA